MKIATGGLGLLLVLAAMPAGAQVALQDEPRPSNIRLQATDEGFVFADSRGMTIYIGVDPKPGISTCTDEVKTETSFGGDPDFALPNKDNRPTCVSKQPPLLVGDAKPVGPWTVVERSDGLKQWAYRGRPLYTSVKDYVPGDINGIGIGYDIIQPNIRGKAGPVFAPTILPPEVRINPLGVAYVLTNAEGRTLYTYDRDSKSKSACEGACAVTWPPVLASATAAPRGDFTLVTRTDKSRQWAFKGKPLYTYADDLEAREINGNGRPNWKVALPYPVPAHPSVMTVVHTILGPRFADSQGRTLYIFMCTEPGGSAGALQLACDDPADRSIWWNTTCGNEAACADMWRPLVADKNAKPIGNIWTLVNLPERWAPVRAATETEPGTKVWAYRGRPVFTFKYETRPAMIEGEDMGILASTKWSSIIAVGTDINQPNTTVQALNVEK